MSMFKRKGPGKGREHLTPEVIVDKNGVQKVVYKNNNMEKQRDFSQKEENIVYNLETSFSSQESTSEGYVEEIENTIDSLYSIDPITVDSTCLDRVKSMTESQFYDNMHYHDRHIQDLQKKVDFVKNGREALMLSTEILSSSDYNQISQDYAASAIEYDQKRSVIKRYDEDIANAVFNSDSSFKHDEDKYFKIVKDSKTAYDKSQIFANSYQKYQDILKKLNEISQNDEMVSKELISERDEQYNRINEKCVKYIKKGKPEWALGHSGTQRNSEAFPKDVISTPELSGRKMMHIKEIAAMTSSTIEEVSKEYTQRLKGQSPQDVEDTLISMYQDAVIQGEKEWIYTDIETSGTGPLNGQIIEQAIVKNGQTENYRFGVGEFHESGSGTGLSNIHGIYPKDVAGMDTYKDSPDAKRISQMFTNGTKENPVIIVAHHGGSFEDDWFNKNIPGYIQAKIENRVIMIDSKTISKHSMGRNKNRLKDYIEAAGGSYENAHSADADTEMMYRATLDWAKKTRNR